MNMISPEQNGPESWTQDPGAEFETEQERDEELSARHRAAREYAEHHLEGAGRDVVDAAMSLVNDHQSDLENPNYIAEVKRRMQLSEPQSEALDGFIAQLKSDRGWTSEADGEANEVAEAGGSPETGVTENASTSESVEAPTVFTDKGEAREAFLQNAEAMESALAAIEVSEDPYQSLDELLAVLKQYTVEMQLDNGKVIKGMPHYLDESGVPQEEWEDWGASPNSRINSGGISALRSDLETALKTGTPFTARQVFSTYYPKSVEQTIDRLFGPRQ